MTTLVWLQRELRLQHHPALETALSSTAQNDDAVIVAYFHDPKHTVGDANSAWLADSLLDLKQRLAAQGGALWLIEGDFAERFQTLLDTHSIKRVHYTFQLGEPFKTLQQTALTICKERNVTLTPFETENWLPYDRLRNQSGQPYKVFTPFYNALMQRIGDVEPFDETPLDFHTTARIDCPPEHDRLPQHLSALRHQPWAEKILKHWQIGEAQAWQKVDDFVENRLSHYAHDRDFPALAATSELSPHLHFGELHSRAVLLSLSPLNPDTPTAAAGWIRQLAWREFARAILWHFPDTETTPFQPKFQGFFTPLSEQDEAHQDFYQAWCRGKTGVPMIDAGMKQLWETGWMHNRVRMLVASWLTKNADIDWRAGEHWFRHTLVDADPANNVMGWQWVAGCGVDAAPYYRLFNPIRQSEKFDADGRYLRQWLPALTNWPSKRIHAPWISGAQPDLWSETPEPIVDLEASRQRHLEKVQALKQRRLQD